jgi:deazaflavin-dependent oxidoreductase (nitroreductase family)
MRRVVPRRSPGYLIEVTDWNAKIIDEFRTNDGQLGGQFKGGTMLLLHHTGAKTGTVRVNPLAYLPDGDRLVIVASKGGHPTNPDWYYNLKANPDATVEVGTDTFPVTATELTGDDYAETWARLVAKMPGFGDYQKGITRQIPLFALHRQA